MKIHFTSLGCSRNLVDTEVMLGLVLQAGMEVIDDHKKADYCVINTCSFLEAAREESMDVIFDIIETKKPKAKVIVTGCMAGSHRDMLKEEFPSIHYFLGAGDVDKILDAINDDLQGEIKLSAKSYLEQGDLPRILSTPKHYAYLKIAEGCKKQCAFCIIPSIKGKLQSKSIVQVVKEFRALIATGVKEVILIAQDLGDFGKDRKRSENLHLLLQELTKVKGDFWIRLLYLYPDEITNELIEIIQSDSRICPYLDMPIQHMSNAVLKRMYRKTTKEQIENRIDTLRRALPNIVIRTSLMVGFPGETEEEFKELMEFVKKYRFDEVFFFIYSREKQSPSYDFENHIEPQIKQQMLEAIKEVQEIIVTEKNKKYLSQKLKVLIDGYHPESENLLVGRFYGQCPEVDGQVIINDWEKVKSFGEFYEIEITDVRGFDLIGKVIKPLTKKTRVLNVV